MKFIDACREVVKTQQFHLIRVRKPHAEKIDATTEYDCKPGHTGNKSRGWVTLDGFTAGVVIAVHDKLNEANRAKFLDRHYTKVCEIAFKLTQKAGA